MSLTETKQRAVERMPDATSPSEGIMTQILRVASDPSIDLDRMDKLMAMHERLQKDQAARDFAEALAQLQAELPLIEQGGLDAHKGVPYSRLEDVIRAVRPSMSKHGFSIGFDITQEPSAVIVTGILTHRGGHERRTTMRLPIDTGPGRNAVQAIGSSETYGRRYVTMALLNIASRKDDDGRGAIGCGEDQSQPELISVDQEMTLRDLLQSEGVSERRALGAMKCERLDQILASKFNDAVALIRRMGAKR